MDERRKANVERDQLAYDGDEEKITAEQHVEKNSPPPRHKAKC